ncbi:methyl-accepting chemotaxis protein, partial [Stappia stellulata]|uniref:methyl-accepting chemotaxis protein n=1 Tax=Stappia stellulata TaxID=71235 RepID=UPI00048EDC33
MRFSDLSIRNKLLISAGALFFTSLIGVTLTGSIVMSNSAEETAMEQARTLLDAYSADVSGEIGASLTVAKSAAAGVEGLLKNDMRDRDALGDMMIRTVENTPGLVGMTLAFEPNGLDGRDADFKTHKYSDANGRFVPYFYYSDGKVVFEKLVMTKEAGTESWYDKPIRENRSQITPPYPYPIDGKEVLLTTISWVVRENGEAIGITTSDLSLAGLVEKMSTLKPFGAGEVKLVGGDNLWVANADPSKLGKPVQDATLLDLMAATGTGDRMQRIGDRFVALTPVSFKGVDDVWYVAIDVPYSAMVAGAISARNMMLAISGVLLVLVMGLVWYGAGALARPVAGLTQVMRRLADGDTSVEVAIGDRKDEIGEMGEAVETFRENALERQRLEAIQGEDEKARMARQARTEELISGFRGTVQQLIGTVSETAQGLDQTARELSASAQDSAERAGETADASSAATDSVQTVASAAEELSASIAEISRQVGQTTQVVSQATEGTHATNEKIAGLAQAASKIGEVVKLITDIAEQTNLLAL